MAACGQDDALDTGLVEALRQIFALLDALVEIVEVLALIQTGGQRHDIAAGHAAVGVIAVAGDLLDLELDADIVFDRAILVEVRTFFQNRLRRGRPECRPCLRGHPSSARP